MDLINTFVGAAALNAADDARKKEIEQQGNDMIRDQEGRNRDAVMRLQQQHIDSLEARANAPIGTNLRELELEKKVKDLEEEIDDLSAEVRKFKTLLSKPMLEIANESGQFKETYQKQQSLLANWIASQRAYKELAMQYGKELGKSNDAVLEESEEAKKVVIENKSDLGNNVDPKVVADLNYEDNSRLERQKKEEKADQIIRELREKRLAKQNS